MALEKFRANMMNSITHRQEYTTYSVGLETLRSTIPFVFSCWNPQVHCSLVGTSRTLILHKISESEPAVYFGGKMSRQEAQSPASTWEVIPPLSPDVVQSRMQSCHVALTPQALWPEPFTSFSKQETQKKTKISVALSPSQQGPTPSRNIGIIEDVDEDTTPMSPMGLISTNFSKPQFDDSPFKAMQYTPPVSSSPHTPLSALYSSPSQESFLDTFSPPASPLPFKVSTVATNSLY